MSRPSTGKFSRMSRGVFATAIATLFAVAIVGSPAQSQTNQERQAEADRQLREGLRKLNICKQRVQSCVQAGNRRSDCRDNEEICFERVYIEYPQVERYE